MKQLTVALWNRIVEAATDLLTDQLNVDTIVILRPDGPRSNSGTLFSIH